MEISNKTLAWLVIAAIVVSIFGTTLSLINFTGENSAGYATSNTTGEAKVLVSSSVVLRFSPTANSTDFGSGQINTAGGYSSCVLGINTTNTVAPTASAGCIGFATTTTGLILENVGTTNLNVTLNFSSNETDFLRTNSLTGNGSRWLRYTVFNTTANGGCYWPNASMWGVWFDVGVPNTTTVICQNLTTSGSGNYRMLIGLNISMNENITNTQKTLTIRAQGTDI